MNTDACLSAAVSGKCDIYCMLIRTSDVLLVAFTDDSIHCNKPTCILYKCVRNMLLAEVFEDEIAFHLRAMFKRLVTFCQGKRPII